MTYDEVKLLLKQLSENKKLMRVIQRQIEEVREQAMLIPALSYEKQRVKGGESTPAQQRFIEHLERLESQFSAAFETVCKAEDMIADNLQNLTPTEQTIIIERYMHGKSWRQIERDCHYSEKHPFKIHNNALKKICEALKEDTK